MAEKKYKEAKAAYERAKGLADDAGKAAATGKAAMKAEVEKGIARPRPRGEGSRSRRRPRPRR